MVAGFGFSVKPTSPNLTQISLSGEITIPAKTDRVPRIWKLNTVTGSNSNATLPESTNSKVTLANSLGSKTTP